MLIPDGRFSSAPDSSPESSSRTYFLVAAGIPERVVECRRKRGLAIVYIGEYPGRSRSRLTGGWQRIAEQNCLQALFELPYLCEQKG